MGFYLFLVVEASYCQIQSPPLIAGHVYYVNTSGCLQLDVAQNSQVLH